MSNLKVYVLRLTEGMEVKQSLEKYVRENVHKGCFVMSCCGSLTKATLRLAANADKSIPNKIVTLNKHFEVLALNGTVSPGGTHLHICLSDNEGVTFGGHVMGDLVVFTTMEIMLGEPQDIRLTREMDPNTHFDELVIINK